MSNATATHWKDLLSRRYETPGTSLGTHYVSQRLGALIAAIAFRLGATPNQLTLAGMLLALLGCVAFVQGSAAFWLTALLCWQLSYAFDCADGQLARGTGMTSDYGAWLDLACDHVREVLFGLSVLYVLLQAEVLLIVSLFVTAVLMSGTLIFLQTASTLRSDKHQVLKLNGTWASWLRFLLRNLLDRPVYMLLLCVFRGIPELLMVYAFFHGTVQALRASVLAYKRMLVNAGR